MTGISGTGGKKQEVRVKRVHLDWLEVIAACVAVIAIGTVYTVAVAFIDRGTTPVRTSSVQNLTVQQH